MGGDKNEWHYGKVRQMRGVNKQTIVFSLGAGCYWSSSLLATISWKDSHSVTQDPLQQALPLLVILVIVIAVSLLSRFFNRRSFQAALAVVGVCAFAVKAAIFFVDGLDSPALYFCFLIAEGSQTASFILLWGLGFAALDKSSAEKTVFLSLMFCFGFYLALSLLPASRWAAIAASGLKAVAVLPFLVSGECYTVKKRTPHQQNYKLLVPVFFSRIFFGTASGIAMAMSTFQAGVSVPASPFICIPLLACLVGAFLYLLKTKAPNAGILRVSPLLIAGVLVAPYLGSGQELTAILHSTFMIVWLSWLVLSSIQLSDLKDKVGWDEARLAFYDKTVYVAAWVATWLLTYTLSSRLNPDTAAHIAFYALPATIYLTLVVSCLLLTALVDGKVWTNTLNKASELMEKREELVYLRVAEAYRLTNQERNIMTLIAEGHKRPYICEKLVLAESTVKSHTKHLYQKLDIHSREELLTVLEEQRKVLSTSSRWDDELETTR